MKTDIPKPFGFPAYFGKISRRRAKKAIRRTKWHTPWDQFKELDGFKVGDLVETCSYFNEKVLAVEARYRKIGKAYILQDISFTCEHTPCSLIHCGIGAPISREKAEKIVEEWRAEDEKAALHYSKEVFTIHEDGRYNRNTEFLCDKCEFWIRKDDEDHKNYCQPRLGARTVELWDKKVRPWKDHPWK
jgi:hypothetical protein